MWKIYIYSAMHILEGKERHRKQEREREREREREEREREHLMETRKQAGTTTT